MFNPSKLVFIELFINAIVSLKSCLIGYSYTIFKYKNYRKSELRLELLFFEYNDLELLSNL